MLVLARSVLLRAAIARARTGRGVSLRSPYRLFIVLTIVFALASQFGTGVQGQSIQRGAPAAKQLRTPWGEPDLQGIWNGETLTPLERPARFANRPVLTPEETAKLEADVAGRQGRDQRAARGTEKDVAGAYNQIFAQRGTRLADGRTSLIIDPSD